MLKKNGILPGIGLSLLLACLAQYLSLFIPKLGPATLAIFLGILLGNTILKQGLWKIGTAWSEKRLLEASVVMLGATVTFQTIEQLRLEGIFYIFVQMALTIIFVIFLGKKLSTGRETGLLLAAGNAICGSSAIASVTTVIRAKDEEKRTAIMTVNLMGTILMLLLPFIGPPLLHKDNLLIGALIGGTVQSVGQVVASGLMVNQQVTTYATLFKIMRILFLVLVVLVFGKMQQYHEGEIETDIKKKKFSLSIPWYVLGFFVLCILNSLLSLPKIIDNSAHTISSWFEITALAAIGLNLNLKGFIGQGKKLAIYGVLILIFQVIVAVTLISIIL